ncbi:hypothetical protein [Pseudolactococcus hodotermopsidis]|nr:hypothetical protein [Lactococcus hodotermopsidis]
MIGLFANLSSNRFGDETTLLIKIIASLLILVSLLPLIKKSVYPKIEQLGNKRKIQIIFGIFLLIISIQLLTRHFFIPSISRDPFRIRTQAIWLAQGKVEWLDYFKRYPNNVPIAIVLSKALKIGWFFKLSTQTIITSLSLISLDIVAIIAVIMTYLASKKTSIALIISCLLLINPFMYTYNLRVFYSDVPAMLGFGSVMLGLSYLYRRPNARFRWLIGATVLIISVVTQLIKPNFIIIVPAIILWLLITALSADKRSQLNRPLIICSASLILLVSLTMPASKIISQQANFEPDSNQQFPTTHWIAMGLNPDTIGTYSQADCDAMDKETTKSGHEKLAMRTIKERLKNHGLIGMVKQISLKYHILLDMGHLNHKYVDGFSDAPAWYQKHAGQYQIANNLLISTLFCLIFSLALLGIKQLWQMEKSFLSLLPVLIIDGLLTFHALFWEVNDRYGEAVIIPILYLSAIGLKSYLAPEKHTFIAQHDNRPARKRLWLPLYFVGLAMLCYLPLTMKVPTTLTVVGQFSNWGARYGNLGTMIAANQKLTQTFTTRTDYQIFQLAILPHQQTGELILEVNGKVLVTKEITAENTKKLITIKQKLPAGNYRLIWHNKSSQENCVYLQNGADYPLSQESILELKDKQYFVFKFANRKS